MIRKPSPQGKFQDVRAVCHIARALLGLDNITGVRGTLGLLAVDFISAPPDVTVEDLLQVRLGTSKILNMSLTTRLFSTHFFRLPYHTVYTRLISFVPLLGKVIFEKYFALRLQPKLSRFG